MYKHTRFTALLTAALLEASLTAWEQELFDAADVTNLKAGDTIVVRGKDITVESVETADDLVSRKDEIDFSCTAMNGTAHIVSGAVESITRVYTP